MRDDSFLWIDCSDIEGTHCYLDDEANSKLLSLTSSLESEGLHWIDSGDYHYMTKLWTDKIVSPFSLVVIDHHPDMQESVFGEMLSCGNWLRFVLDNNAFLQKAFLIGVDDKLVHETNGYGDKLTVFSESQVMAGVPVSVQIDGKVYLSVDKDALGSEYVSTDWEQGRMTQKQLFDCLSSFDKNNVIGVDICGEEPKTVTDSSYNADYSLNERFNAMLYNFLINTFCNVSG